MRLRGVLFERLGNHGSRIERHFDVPWAEDDVLGLFEAIDVRGKDDQQLWGGAVYEEGKSRGNAGILCNTAALLDHDCCDVGTMARTTEHLRAQGLAFVVYTSWSHGSPDKTPKDLPELKGPFDCYRIVIPFSRDVSPDEYRAIIPGLFGYELPEDPPKYAQEVQGVLITLASGRERAARPRGWDPVSSRPTQGYYTPAPHAAFELYEGKPLDVEAVLKRPTTSEPRARIAKAYRPATMSGLTVLGKFQNALVKAGFGMGRSGFSGWHRSTCPSCQDPSPSLTVRANGDGLDLYDHGGCKRREVLDSLGLGDDDTFAATSDLQALLEEQLSRQLPPGEAVAVDAAVEALERDIDEALESREATVIKYPAGTGKSHACAKSITKQVRQGDKVAYSTQEHTVAHETREKLPPDIKARSVHIHSPLIQVGTTPACRRAAELSERVWDFGLSLMGKVCPRCPFRGECDALAAARERAQLLSDASVVFVSHAGISQVFGAEGRGADLKLIVDEMPSAFVSLSVDRESLRELSERPILPSADNTGARLAQSYARAWTTNSPPAPVAFGDRVIGTAEELLAACGGRLRLRDGAKPLPSEKALLRAADRVLRLAWHKEQGGVLMGLDDATESVEAMIPDACHQALIDRKGVLLSATPLMAALPEFKLKETEVTDGAPVRRVMVLRSSRGSKALTSNYYNDDTGRREVRDAEPDEMPGIPWPWLDEALARAREEAKRYECKRILFVTFKSIADAIRGSARLRGESGVDVVVAHYGALRGKNDWMEGRPDECSVVYCFGTPRFNMRSTFVALGLYAEAADRAWVDYAAGELAQAEGRLRLPRRRLPCSVVVEGDVAPSSWHPDLVDELVTPDDLRTASGALEDALIYRGLGELEEEGYEGVAESVYRGALVTEAPDSPDLADAMHYLSRMNPARRRWIEDNVIWVDAHAHDVGE